MAITSVDLVTGMKVGYITYVCYIRVQHPTISDKEVAFNCNVNGTSARMTLEQWQSYGLDIGTIVKTASDIRTVIEWGRKMLQGTM